MSGPRPVHPAHCWCPTCFPVNGATVALDSARWQDVKAATADPALNLSGDQFELTRAMVKGRTEITARLASEAGWRDGRQNWSWHEDPPARRDRCPVCGAGVRGKSLSAGGGAECSAGCGWECCY